MVVVVPDEELVARGQRGDREAFGELVVRHADRLHAVALRLVGDDHDAREVTQEAFLRAWRGLRQFNGNAQFGAWIYRIAVNEATRLLSARTRDSALSGRRIDELPSEPADPGRGPAVAVEHRDLGAALEAAVARLHPEYRLPLVLRDVEGLSTAEAASAMDLGEAAFKSRLHRARQQVRAEVQDLL